MERVRLLRAAGGAPFAVVALAAFANAVIGVALVRSLRRAAAGVTVAAGQA